MWPLNIGEAKSCTFLVHSLQWDSTKTSSLRLFAFHLSRNRMRRTFVSVLLQSLIVCTFLLIFCFVIQFWNQNSLGSGRFKFEFGSTIIKIGLDMVAIRSELGFYKFKSWVRPVNSLSSLRVISLNKKYICAFFFYSLSHRSMCLLWQLIFDFLACVFSYDKMSKKAKKWVTRCSVLESGSRILKPV